MWQATFLGVDFGQGTFNVSQHAFFNQLLHELLELDPKVGMEPTKIFAVLRNTRKLNGLPPQIGFAKKGMRG